MASDEETILLIGGSSFLGLQTAETLYYFFDIVCTYNQSSIPKYYPEFNWYQMNLLQQPKDLKANLKRLIEKTNAKYIVNFAGITNPLEAKQQKENSDLININANEIIAQTCGELNVTPIFISSDHVFNGNSGPYAEDENPHPLKNSTYGNQKLIAESYYRKQEKHAVLRLSMMFGTAFLNQKRNIFDLVLSQLEQGLAVQGATNKIRTYSHYSNVSFVINKIVEGFEDERFSKEVFHLPGELMSEYEFLKKILSKTNHSESLIQPIEINDDNMSYPLTLGLHSRKSEIKLKGRLLTLDEGLNLLLG